jgi:flagellar biosynthesis/type III secretory pathway ATPase
MYPKLMKFLQQGMHESVALKSSLDSLHTIVQPVHGAKPGK